MDEELKRALSQPLTPLSAKELRMTSLESSIQRMMDRKPTREGFVPLYLM